MNFYIENFQSIKSINIDLEYGLTPIIGESDLGKSAIVRAYQTLTTNNWEANFLRHGSDECIIGLTLPEDAKYDLITITKSKSKNQYDFYQLEEGAQHPQLVEISAIISSPNYRVVETYPKIGGQPHEKVLEVLSYPLIKTVREDKIDLSVRDQLTTLFMVTDSSQYNTSLINQLSGLDAIDLAIKDSNKLANTFKGVLTSLPAEINQLETSITESKRVQKELEESLKTLNIINELKAEYLSKLDDVSSITNAINEIDTLINKEGGLSALRAEIIKKNFIQKEAEIKNLDISKTHQELREAESLLKSILGVKIGLDADTQSITRLRPIEGVNSMGIIPQDYEASQELHEASRLRDLIRDTIGEIQDMKETRKMLSSKVKGLVTIEEYTPENTNTKQIQDAKESESLILEIRKELENLKNIIRVKKIGVEEAKVYIDHKDVLMHMAFESCPECHQKLPLMETI